VDADSRVIISHTDCDSVISPLIVRGLLPPDRIFGEAVIAADHTGEENLISDLLQALYVRRDFNFSARNLALLLQGEPLDRSAQKLVDKRSRDRRETIETVFSGNAVKQSGDLTIVYMNSNMLNQFMPVLFPEASVILTYEQGKMGLETS
jgi:hypothetical protein